MGKATKKCWFIEINSVLIYSSLGAFNIEKASVPTIVFRDILCPPLVKTEVQQGSARQGYRGLESGYPNTPVSLRRGRRGSWAS